MSLTNATPDRREELLPPEGYPQVQAVPRDRQRRRGERAERSLQVAKSCGILILLLPSPCSATPNTSRIVPVSVRASRRLLPAEEDRKTNALLCAAKCKAVGSPI